MRVPAAAEVAPAFFRCIDALAQQHTNPVLLLLEGIDRLESQRRYPEGGLSLMDDRWRCFYHCHDAPQRPPEEHGHFHFFAACEAPGGSRSWSHVAALSMDGEGQPLAWLTLNRWVTDGPWLAAETLAGLLNWPTVRDETPLLQRWLALAAQFYAELILELLTCRDRNLMEIKASAPQADILEDRSVYQLSARRVDLRADLTTALIGEDEVSQ